jgi:hypothetical protein
MDIKLHRRLWVCALGIAAVMMVAAGLTLAAAAPAWAKPITVTTHTHELQAPGMGGSFIGTMPCQGDQLYEIWAPANEVFHVTAAGQKPNGDYIPPFRIHYSAIGRVLAVPVDGSGPTFRGHYKDGPEQIIVKQFPPFIGTYIWHETVIAKGSDGSRLYFRHQVVFHVNQNLKVTVSREIFRPTAECVPPGE